MKIAFVYDSVYPFRKGGVERRNFEVGKRFASDHEVFFVSEKLWDGGDEKKIDEFTYIGVSSDSGLYSEDGVRSVGALVRYFFGLFKLFRYKFDVIDCSSIPPTTVLICWLYSKIRRVPMVVTWHEYWTYGMWKDYAGPFVGDLAFLIQGIARFLTQNGVAVSNLTARSLETKKTSVVPNGVDLGMLADSQGGKDYDLVFSGRLIADKNPLFFLRVVKILAEKNNNLRVLMIGAGPLEEEVDDYIANHSLEGVVERMANVSDEHYYSELSKGRVFVLPSEREGFGIVGVEALALGMYFVTLDAENNAATELVSGDEYGVVVQKDESLFVEKLELILNDESLFLDAIIKKRRDFARQYDWEVISLQLKKTYESLANSK